MLHIGMAAVFAWRPGASYFAGGDMFCLSTTRSATLPVSSSPMDSAIIAGRMIPMSGSVGHGDEALAQAHFRTRAAMRIWHSTLAEVTMGKPVTGSISYDIAAR